MSQELKDAMEREKDTRLAFDRARAHTALEAMLLVGTHPNDPRLEALRSAVQFEQAAEAAFYKAISLTTVALGLKSQAAHDADHGEVVSDVH